MTSNKRDTGFRAILRKPVAVAAMAFLLFVILVCSFAAFTAPYNPLSQDLSAVEQLPSAAHWLGTDTLGRDVLSRLLWGGQPALLGALVAVLVFAVFGIVFGLIAGYARDSIDRLISGAVDILMSLPSLIVTFAVLALFDNSLTAAMVTLGFFSSGGLVRVVRAATKVTREELYVAAARVSGLGNLRIMFRHILPRLAGPVIVQISLFAGIALIVQSGLGFLNLGVSAPAPSWGGMVGEAAQVLQQFPWLLVPSGGIIGLTILAAGLIGDAVRDVNAEAISRSGGYTLRKPKKFAPLPAGNGAATTGAADIEAELEAATGSARPVDALLRIDGLSITFVSRTAETTVVHSSSFEIRPGELVGLVGESGSGKTVTALSTLGLLPGNARVDARAIVFDGVDLSNASAKAIRAVRGQGIGLISQEPMVALDPSFTVGSQLTEVLSIGTHLSRAERQKRAEQLLRDVRLPDPADTLRRYPHELSGGMAQRVVIAMALARGPKLLIADEPTTALDVTVQAEILDLLRQLRDERGMAILLVTHDLGVVADICERVIVMQNGRVVEQQDVFGLFAAPEHPYTRALIAATPNLLGTTVTSYASVHADTSGGAGSGSAGSGTLQEAK
jgi:peptide/nickel transport system permease protein